MSEENRNALATAIMQAIVDQSTVRHGDETILTLSPYDVASALVNVLACVLDPTIAAATPKAIRETSEDVAGELKGRLKALRKIYEETGKRPFDVEIVTKS